MIKSTILASSVLLLSYATHGGEPILDLTFADPARFLVPTVGNSLSASGPCLTTDGPNFENTSMRIPKGTSLSASTGFSILQEYTLILDVRIYTKGVRRGLLQTNPQNTDDADLFISSTGTIGNTRIGYSSSALQTGQWHRLALAYREGARLDLFLDGKLVHSVASPSAQQGLSLDSLFLLFADDNGEQDTLDVSRISLMSTALDSQSIRELGTPQDRAFTARPWLQNVSDTAITIMWESNRPTEGLVRFGSGASLDRSARSSSLYVSPKLYIHKVRLSGLSPKSRYQYLVTMGSTSLEGSFSTAPVIGTGEIRFGIWGDSHYPDPARKMFRYMVDSLKVDFAATTGDVSNHGYDPADLKANFAPSTLNGVGAKVPFFIATGDHDVGSTQGVIRIIRHYFDNPKEINSDSNGIAGSYVVFYGPVAMIFIDWQRIEIDIPGWLDRQLKSDAVRNSRFVFTFIHRAPYYERWQSAGENSFVKYNYPPVIEANGVHASFSGHMHGYERGLKNGTYYITTGGGSYLDVKETVGKNYDFIFPGAFESSPTNYGLLNQIMTVDANVTQATIRMHAFDSAGNYLGVRDSMSLLGRPLTSATPPAKSTKEVRLHHRGGYLEVEGDEDGDFPLSEGFLTLSSIDGHVVRRTRASERRMDLSSLPSGLHIARWHSARQAIVQPIYLLRPRSTN